MSAITTTPAPLTEESLPGRTEHLRRRALTVGAAGLGVWLVMAVVTRAAFPAYLVAFTFVLGLPVGSLGFLMLHHLVGGKWGFVVRRPLEAAISTLPLMALLFLPLLFGMHTLYEWTNPEAVRASEVLRQKAGYLNVTFWVVRAAVYFTVWAGLGLLLRRNSAAQDATADPAPTERNRTLSAPGLIVTFLAVTFAAIDWLMSIEPEWYSTIYGVMVMIGWAVSALATIVVVSSWLSEVRTLAGVADAEGFNDLGNLLLAFTMLWAYMSFSQYLIIWMGDLTEEVPWYLKRSYGGWRLVCGSLIAVHFFLPFFCLLVRQNKRQPGRLWRVAALLLVMHLVNDAWLVIPAFPRSQWLQLLALAPALAGVGGLWLWAFTRDLTSRPLLPRHDPLLADVLAHHAHHGGGH